MSKQKTNTIHPLEPIEKIETIITHSLHPTFQKCIAWERISDNETHLHLLTKLHPKLIKQAFGNAIMTVNYDYLIQIDLLNPTTFKITI